MQWVASNVPPPLASPLLLVSAAGSSSAIAVATPFAAVPLLPAAFCSSDRRRPPFLLASLLHRPLPPPPSFLSFRLQFDAGDDVAAGVSFSPLFPFTTPYSNLLYYPSFCRSFAGEFRCRTAPPKLPQPHRGRRSLGSRSPLPREGLCSIVVSSRLRSNSGREMKYFWEAWRFIIARKNGGGHALVGVFSKLNFAGGGVKEEAKGGCMSRYFLCKKWWVLNCTRNLLLECNYSGVSSPLIVLK